jgi:Mn-dependent DtxR family transcriptional regulator
MSERRAGAVANRVHAAYSARQITLREALNLLESISHHLSTTQFHRLMDLQTYAQYNPHRLDVKGG